MAQPHDAQIFNQKSTQGALHTGLSYHTVRSYSKELYAALQVSSREELMVKIRKHQGTP